MFFRQFPALMLGLFLCFAAIPARAELSIAVVDVQKLLIDSSAAKSLQGQMSKQRESFQAEFSKYERELHESEKSLAEQRDKISADEYTKKREAFEARLLETRQLVQKRKRALDEGFNKAIGSLQAEIIKIVAALAEEKGYQVVLTRQNVVIVEKSLDITEAVMERLNKALPDVTLKLEEKQG